MNEIRYDIVVRQDREDLLEFLLDFFRVEEPITSSVGTTKEDATQFYNDLVDGGLKGPVSYIARDASKGHVVGCRLNEVIDIAPGREKTPEKSPDYGKVSTNFVAGFVDDLSEPLYRLLPDSKRMMKFIVVGVHPDYFRKGIGTTLIKLSVDKAKECGCDWITTTATALRSQNLFEKLGFQTLHQLSYSEYTKDGGVVFKHLHDGAIVGKLMGLKIY